VRVAAMICLILNLVASFPLTILKRINNKQYYDSELVVSVYAPSDSPPSGWGRPRYSCGQIFHMCRSTEVVFCFCFFETADRREETGDIRHDNGQQIMESDCCVLLAFDCSSLNV
jgi:hypothetical protein